MYIYIYIYMYMFGLIMLYFKFSKIKKAVDSATGEIVGAVELIMLPYPASPSPQAEILISQQYSQLYVVILEAS